jgi:hypothetical protein
MVVDVVCLSSDTDDDIGVNKGMSAATQQHGPYVTQQTAAVPARPTTVLPLQVLRNNSRALKQVLQ